MANPVCFFDVTLGGEPLGRIKMELFNDVVPKVRAVHALDVYMPICKYWSMLIVLRIQDRRELPSILHRRDEESSGSSAG